MEKKAKNKIIGHAVASVFGVGSLVTLVTLISLNIVIKAPWTFLAGVFMFFSYDMLKGLYFAIRDRNKTTMQ